MKKQKLKKWEIASELEAQRKSGIQNLQDQLYKQVADKLIEGLLIHSFAEDKKSYQSIYRVFCESSVNDWFQMLSATPGCQRVARILSAPDSRQTQSFFISTVQIAGERFKLKENADNQEDFFKHMQFTFTV